ncbi:MAG: TetR/AcrR family transcriptional regulator [Alphaproteobacteria bacterium]|nr:MAG: TetR/AcrR family transcriptional regulator [Alphaproteobacteria bacterium]
MTAASDPMPLLPADAPGLRAGAADRAASEAMQRRILETAERLFRQYGYRKTTVADIAAELGMSSANVYRFFASKNAIVEAVTRKATLELAAAVRAATGRPGLDAAQRLEAFVRVTFATVRERCLSGNHLHELVQEAFDRSWPAIHDHKLAMRSLLAGIIAEGMAAGELAPGDPEEAAACFQLAMVAALHPMLIEQCLRDGEDLEARIAPLLRLALRGLGVRA